MIWRLGFLCAALAGTGYGKDVYQPVKKGATELGIGYGFAQSLGGYDAEGDFKHWSELLPAAPAEYRPAAYGFPFRIKYGLGGGVDVKAEWDAVFTNKDLGNLSGMGQPSFGIKYANPIGGFFANTTLPFATGDIDDKKLYTSIEVGGLVRKKLHHFRFTGLLSYIEILEKNDVLHLSAQPEILWTRGRSTFFSVEYLRSVTQKNVDVLSVTPGIRADITDAVNFDAAVGFTVAGRNSPAAWGLKMDLYWTFGR